MHKSGDTAIAAGVKLQFRYSAGAAASRFLIALRDERKIYGTRCPGCRRVMVPARSFCPRCGRETAEWLEVGPAGRLIAFAVAQPTQPLAPQPLLALIQLDGADTALVHRIGEADPATLFAGRRVTAVFAETRNGSILDIAYFKPLEVTHADSI
ncbi:MAG: Zn-ribbon domain-containing OB-fold protein [Ardenticatenaceae bacterium]|nr:Zn-ribbon domain-containing OB-fold protein [Ardenticatenaceae bacterium]